MALAVAGVAVAPRGLRSCAKLLCPKAQSCPWGLQGGYMTLTRQGVPEGSSAIIPRLFCRDVAAEIDFCARTFDAEIRVQRPGPDQAVAHALLLIGPAMLMIEAEWPGVPTRAPQQDGSSPVVLYVYVENVDETVARAVEQGAKILYPVENQFWGDRMGWIMDPAGHVWTVATRIEATTEEQRQARLKDMMEKKQ